MGVCHTWVINCAQDTKWLINGSKYKSQTFLAIFSKKGYFSQSVRAIHNLCIKNPYKCRVSKKDEGSAIPERLILFKIQNSEIFSSF